MPLLDVEGDAVERDDSAEAQGDVPYLEEGHPAGDPKRARTRQPTRNGRWAVLRDLITIA